MKRIHFAVLAFTALVLAGCASDRPNATEATEQTVSEQVSGSAYWANVEMFSTPDAREAFNQSLAEFEKELNAKEGLSQEDREAQLRENRLSLARQYVAQQYVANLKVTSIPSEIRGKSADEILTQMKEEEKVAADLETKLAQEGLADEEKATLETQLSESRKIARLAQDWKVEIKVDETATKEDADPMLPIASALSEIGKSAVRVEMLVRHVPGASVFSGLSSLMLPAFTPAVAYLDENFVGRTHAMTELGKGGEVLFSFKDVVVDDLGFTVKEFDEYNAADAGTIDAKIGRSLPVLYGQMRVLRPAKGETPAAQPEEAKKDDASAVVPSDQKSNDSDKTEGVATDSETATDEESPEDADKESADKSIWERWFFGLDDQE